MKNRSVFIFWCVVSFLAFVNLLVFDLMILFAPEKLQVQFVPDDAYYYLQLAKNFVKFGYWTFDSGLSVASGFHPLLAYVLALLYRLFHPDTKLFVVLDIVLSSSLTLGLVGWIWVKSLIQQNINFLIFLTLCIGARSFLRNSVSGVEWPFVIILTTVYCLIFYHVADIRKGSAVMFAVGLLLSLARTDSGLFPFALFLASLILYALKLFKDKVILTSSLSGLFGAGVGLGLAFLNNYSFTGNLLQSSARMKYFWSKFGGSSYGMTVTIPLRGIGFDFYFDDLHKIVSWLPFLYLYILLTLFILQTRAYRNKFLSLELPTQTLRGSALFMASLISVIGYLVVYRYDGVIQNWYTANLMIPLFILGVGTAGYLKKLSRAKNDFATIGFSLVTLITFICNLFWTYPIEIQAPWPHQQFMLEAGKYLHQLSLDGRISAWNSGIIGYYQGGTVINIDGLVNEDIYPYAVQNRLPSYLKDKGIRYIVDFQLMFSPGFRQRGGYDIPAFLQELQPLITFDQGQFAPWQFLTLYKIRD